MKNIHFFIFILFIILYGCKDKAPILPIPPIPLMKISCTVNQQTYSDIKVSAKRFKSKIALCLELPDRKNITFFLRVPPNGVAKTTYKFAPDAENMVAYHKDTFELPHCSFYPTSKGGELNITKIDQDSNAISGNFKLNISNQAEEVQIEGNFEYLRYKPSLDEDREGTFFTVSQMNGTTKYISMLPRDRCIHYTFDKQIDISTAFAYASSLQQYGIYFSDKIAEGTYEMKEYSLYMISGRYTYSATNAPSKLVIMKHDTLNKQIAGAFYGTVSSTNLDYGVFYGTY